MVKNRVSQHVRFYPRTAQFATTVQQVETGSKPWLMVDEVSRRSPIKKWLTVFVSLGVSWYVVFYNKFIVDHWHPPQQSSSWRPRRKRHCHSGPRDPKALHCLSCFRYAQCLHRFPPAISIVRCTAWKDCLTNSGVSASYCPYILLVWRGRHPTLDALQERIPTPAPESRAMIDHPISRLQLPIR